MMVDACYVDGAGWLTPRLRRARATRTHIKQECSIETFWSSSKAALCDGLGSFSARAAVLDIGREATLHRRVEHFDTAMSKIN